MNTIHVVAVWDDESERWWFEACEPGDHDDDSNAFEGDVPVELWARRTSALAAWEGADNALAALLDLDVGRLTTACAEWHGDTFPGLPATWQVVLAASPHGDEWPVREVAIGWTHDNAADAQAVLDDLPDEFWLYAAGPGPVRITKDRLTIVEHPASPGRSYDCHRCGRSLDEHGSVS